jgi:copper homeostasis protein CutC
VMAAGGIRPDNLAQILAGTGLRQIHAGPGRPLTDESQPASGPLRFDSPPPENPAFYRTTCLETVRQLSAFCRGQNPVKP